MSKIIIKAAGQEMVWEPKFMKESDRENQKGHLWEQVFDGMYGGIPLAECQWGNWITQSTTKKKSLDSLGCALGAWSDIPIGMRLVARLALGEDMSRFNEEDVERIKQTAREVSIQMDVVRDIHRLFGMMEAAYQIDKQATFEWLPTA